MGRGSEGIFQTLCVEFCLVFQLPLLSPVLLNIFYSTTDDSVSWFEKKYLRTKCRFLDFSNICSTGFQPLLTFVPNLILIFTFKFNIRFISSEVALWLILMILLCKTYDTVVIFLLGQRCMYGSGNCTIFAKKLIIYCVIIIKPTLVIYFS